MAFTVRHVAFDPADNRPAPRRYAWSVFAVLFALMVVDYVDRQVVVSMFSHLKAQWDLSDRQLGALVSIVSITVALGAVPLSLLADRWSRVKSVFLMALIWSLATISCAFATSYGQLIGARALVGVGEAAYGTVGAALLASLFPARMRSTVLGAFLAAGMMGSVLGVVLGGFIAQHWGWQAGFGAVGIPGLLLCVVFLLVVRDYKTVALPAKDATGTAHRLSARAVVGELLRPRTALVTCIGAGLNLLVVSTTWAWLPSYLNRYYGLAPDQAGLRTGIVVLVGGLGALAWSAVADRLEFTDLERAVDRACDRRGTDHGVHVCRLCRPPARQRAISADRRRRLRHGRQHRPDGRGCHRRHSPGPARNRGLRPVAHPEPVRARRRAAPDRRAVRCLRIAIRDVRGARDLSGRGRRVRAGGADLRGRP